MSGVAIRIDALSGARRLTRRAAADTALTALTGRASVVASAAMLHVAQRIDAARSALKQVRSTSRGAARLRADLARWTHGAAAATVLAVARGIDARLVAHREPGLTVAGSGLAELSCLTADPAVSTVLDVVRDVDAIRSAALELALTSTGRLDAATTGRAALRAGSTMRAVGVEVDARAGAASLPRAAIGAARLAAGIGVFSAAQREQQQERNRCREAPS